MMKVAIFNGELFWTPHFGTGLEIIEQHLLQQDEVFQFVCNGFLKECDQNMEGNPIKCDLCIQKRGIGSAPKRYQTSPSGYRLYVGKYL
jgi:hypothetical protein